MFHLSHATLFQFNILIASSTFSLKLMSAFHHLFNLRPLRINYSSPIQPFHHPVSVIEVARWGWTIGRRNENSLATLFPNAELCGGFSEVIHFLAESMIKNVLAIVNQISLTTRGT
jgi:hypothetical protein